MLMPVEVGGESGGWSNHNPEGACLGDINIY